MDEQKELSDFFEKTLELRHEIENEMELAYQVTTSKLDQLFIKLTSDLQSNNNHIDKTPQQIKKKTKRLTTITSDPEDDSICSNNDKSEISTQNESNTSRRPQRAAKLNLDFKEPPINKKYRRPSNINESGNFYNKKKIKEEENLNITNNKKSIRNDKKENMSKKSSLLIEQEMEIDENLIVQSNNNVDDKILSDESVQICQINSKEATVLITDSENEIEIMPPPAVPSKKNLRNKKQSQSSSDDNSAVASIKLEKLSLIDGTNDNNSLKNPIVKIEKLSVELQIESTQQSEILSTEISQSDKSKKRHGKKGKKLPKPMKEERISSENINTENSTSQRITRAKNKISATNLTNNAPIVVPNVEKNISIESVYEDAVPTIDDLQPPPKSTTPINHQSVKDKSPINDATFVSAKDIGNVVVSVAADATFVSQSNLISAQSTFMVMNETHCVNEPGPIDMTFDVPPPNDGNNKEKILTVRDSLMTEDESEVEEIPKKYVQKPKSRMNKKELFNPFVQSPLKKKVEAFEKQAFNNVNSPIPQRQTRTKTRANQQVKENTEPITDGKINNENMEIIKKKAIKEKVITPLIGQQIGRLLQSSQQSYTTPGIGGIVKKLPSSTSKILGLQKTLQSAVTSSAQAYRTPSQTRDNSVEDLRRYGFKLQEQVEERKRKRELKQLQAQQVRERKEKERADNLKRVMEEREEKARRKAAEAEQRRQIDEINRQLKLQEEKREQQRKLERQKQLERETAEIARKEREILENLKIQNAKEKMQQKLVENKKKTQQKIVNNGPKYDFNMLNSDDSTDDESTSKTNRPPVPHWSKPTIRQIAFERQAHIPTRIIDSFFSVQPLTPDLRDIFPNIDAKYLKRNSSVYWKTPPRYSQLPKHNNF